MQTKQLFLSLLWAGSSLTGAMAQEYYFPMEPQQDGTVTEQVSGSPLSVRGVHVLPAAKGVEGGALRLDGYSNYVEGALSYAKLGGSAMTLSLWCAVESYPMMNVAEAEATPTYGVVAGNLDDDRKTGFALMLNSQGGYQFKCYLKSWVLTCVAEDVMPMYEWTHLAVTLDQSSNQIVLYRNGKQVGQAKCPYELTVGAANWRMGKGSEVMKSGVFDINTFNGAIDEVKIWNRVLSADELSRLSVGGGAADLAVPASAWDGDVLHPRWHGMPSHGWTNECHGMVMADGKYHLFFQKNGNGPYMARLHWGHLLSTDLLTWEEAPAALTPGDVYDKKGCWSGCVMQDGLVTGGEPWLVYTGVDNVKATIDMARPVGDDLLTWRKDEANPLIAGRPAGLSDDFRDPYFFRTNEGAFLIVGSSKDGVGTCTLHKYDAQTKTWSNTGDLFYTGEKASQCGTFWEMPNVTKMGDKWLMTVTPQGSDAGVRTIYYVGNVDARGHFVPESSTPQTVELSGMAREGYGMLSPTILQTADGKTIALGIVPDKLASEENYRMGYAHCYSLPREWSLDASGKLVQKPYSGLRALRSEEKASVGGRQVEALIEFGVADSDVGVELLKYGEKSAKIYYHPADNTLCVDMTSLERKMNDAGVFDGLYKSVLPRVVKQGEKMSLDVFLDGSVLDIFVNDEWATSVRVFCTDTDAVGVELLNEGALEDVTFEAWNLTGGGTTAIESVNVEKEMETSGNAPKNFSNMSAPAGIYDLTGRKLPVVKEGICIVNGKKIVNSKK